MRLAKRVTRRWLSSQKSELLSVEVPEGCEAIIAGRRSVPRLREMSLAAFGDTALKEEALRRYVTKAHAIIIGLQVNKELIAYCVAEFNRRQKRVYIIETYVSRQGQGYGTWLRMRLEAISVARGYSSINSNVRVTNRAALLLNKKCGMKIEARIKEYYEDYTDAFYLKKRLIEG